MLCIQVFMYFTLLCPPLFYILAAEKERLESLKQWCLLRSNQVNVMLRHGGPENNGPEPTNDGLGPTNVDIETGPANDDLEATAGQSNGERQDRSGAPSQGGAAGHPGLVEEKVHSLKAARLNAMKQWFRLKSNQVIEIQGGPSNDDTGQAQDVIVSRVMMSSCHDGPEDRHQGLAAAGQGSGERQDRGGSPSQAGTRYRGQAKELDYTLHM
jgi:hypothetical protein